MKFSNLLCAIMICILIVGFETKAEVICEEPTGENFTDFEEIELGIIPGVSFDRQGNRLGRGKGYYDKLLPLLPHSYNIGICYRFQAREEIPCEPFDRRMEEVWTEEGKWE